MSSGWVSRTGFEHLTLPPEGECASQYTKIASLHNYFVVLHNFVIFKPLRLLFFSCLLSPSIGQFSNKVWDLNKTILNMYKMCQQALLSHLFILKVPAQWNMSISITIIQQKIAITVVTIQLLIRSNLLVQGWIY